MNPLASALPIFNNNFATTQEKTKFILLTILTLGVATFISSVWSNAFQSIVISYRNANVGVIDDITFAFLVAIFSTIIVIIVGILFLKFFPNLS